jgi:hypothetical protein
LEGFFYGAPGRTFHTNLSRCFFFCDASSRKIWVNVAGMKCIGD